MTSETLWSQGYSGQYIFAIDSCLYQGQSSLWVYSALSSSRVDKCVPSLCGKLTMGLLSS